MDFNSYGTGNSGTIDSINTATNTITVSGKAAWAKGIIYLNNVPAGTYRLKYTVSSNSSASAAITMNEGSTQKTSKVWNNSTGDYTSGEITFGNDAKSLYITANNSTSTLTNSVTITITNVMLIPAPVYDAGFTDYQPYALPNATLTPALVECVDNGVKNTLDFANLGSPILSHVTYTKTATDITCTSNGSWAYIMFPFSLVSGNYNFSFMASNYSKTGGTIRVTLYTDSTATTAVDTKEVTGNGSYNFDFMWTGGTLYLGIYVNQNGTSYTNTVTIGQVMICKESEYNVSPTYQPYAFSNATITPALKECVDNGAKNLLDFSGSTPTSSSYATITDNKDGTYTATKTGSNTETPYIPAYLKAGTYIYSGCPANGSNDTYSLDIRTSTGTYIDGSSEYGNGVQVTIPSDGWYRIVTRFASTYTNTTGLTFKPMLCDPALWAISPTFKPYALPNTTLTSGLNSYIENGVRNFAKYNHNIASWPGVTINVSDDAVSVSGTSSSSYTGFICSGLNLLVKEPFVVKIIGTYSGFSIIVQIINTSGTRLYWDLSLDRTVPSGYKIEGVYMQRQSATSSVVSGDFNVLITPKAIYDLGVKDYEPFAESNAELTNNISTLNTLIATYRFSNADAVTIRLPSRTSRTLMLIGYLQGIGNVNYTLEIDGSGVLTVKNSYNGSTVSSTGISFDTDAKALTLTGLTAGYSTATLIATAI